MIRYIELFAGIRGFRYGIEESNRQQQENTEVSGCGDSIGGESNQPKQSPQRWHYACVWANDIDKYACAIARKQYGDITEGDIRTIDADTIPNHDIICAGFPCQSFSLAGERGGFTDIRGTLFFEICRIAGAKRTPYLWLENVKGLLSAPYTEYIETWDEEDFDEDGEPTSAAKRKHKAIPGTKGWVFLTILNTLWELGYDCQWQVLNSKDWGLPQNRERVFVIGHLRGQHNRRPKVFPIGKDNEGIDEGESKTTNIRTIQGGGHSGGHHSGRTLIKIGKLHEGDSMGSRVYSSDGLATTINSIGEGLGAKTGIYAVPISIRSYPRTGKNDINRHQRIEPKQDGIANTISSVQKDSMIAIHNMQPRTGNPKKGGTGHLKRKDGIAYNLDVNAGQSLEFENNGYRRLTPIECERLQGFPDNWTEYGLTQEGETIKISDTQRYKCCGNAVSTTVITVIANQLSKELNLLQAVRPVEQGEK